MPQPSASLRSLISWFNWILSSVALATFKILPFNGSIACVLRLRPCLADPPAESPSTIKISVPSAEFCEQSDSFPGRRNLLVADWRLRTLSWRFFNRILERSCYALGAF